MSVQFKVSAADAKKVRAAVARKFDAYQPNEQDLYLKPGPEEGLGEGAWALCWEGGAYDWPFLTTSGGVDEEMAAAAEEFGARVPEVEPLKIDGVFLEPVNGWCLGIYPEW